MKIYTKTGDDGETGLFGGHRVPKDHVRIEAYGAVDELNSFLGWCCSMSPPPGCVEMLTRIQHELFTAGAELARGASSTSGPTLTEAYVARLERDIDRVETELEPLRQFILPGGVPPAAVLHVARSVCRRAERRVTTLARTPGAHVSGPLLRYFNRLGDLLFVLARSCNRQAGTGDTPWSKPEAPG